MYAMQSRRINAFGCVAVVAERSCQGYLDGQP